MFLDSQCRCGHMRYAHELPPHRVCKACNCSEFVLHEKHFRHDADAWKQKEMFEKWMSEKTS